MVTMQQLKYFRELAKTGNQSKTAEKLYITQTTLSNTIKNLERQLGVNLFERAGRSLRLSRAGERYLVYVNEALTALENAQSMLDDYREDGQQSVSVAMTSSGVWSNLVYGFRTQYPTYNLRQVNGDKAGFRTMLTEQQIDFVITGLTDFPLSGLEYDILSNERLYLCVSKDHPFANRTKIFLKEARNEPFINLPESSGFRGFCDDLFQKAGVDYRAVLECDYTLRGKLVAAGYGVAITTDTSRRQQILGGDIAYIPIADSFAKRQVAIIWNPRHYLSRAALDFKDFIRTAKQNEQE